MVHHVVVLELALADLEVVAFDLLLRLLDLPRGHLHRDGLALGPLVEEEVQPLRPEQPHQFVFERNVEARGAGVALTSGTAAQLVVDAAAFVALGAEDVQPAETDHFLPVRPARLLRLRQRLLVCSSRGLRAGQRRPGARLR